MPFSSIRFLDFRYARSWSYLSIYSGTLSTLSLFSLRTDFNFFIACKSLCSSSCILAACLRSSFVFFLREFAFKTDVAFPDFTTSLISAKIHEHKGVLFNPSEKTGRIAIVWLVFWIMRFLRSAKFAFTNRSKSLGASVFII